MEPLLKGGTKGHHLPLNHVEIALSRAGGQFNSLTGSLVDMALLLATLESRALPADCFEHRPRAESYSVHYTAPSEPFACLFLFVVSLIFDVTVQAAITISEKTKQAVKTC
jgi:hypothetical protein